MKPATAEHQTEEIVTVLITILLIAATICYHHHHESFDKFWGQAWKQTAPLGSFGAIGKPGPRPATWPFAPPRFCQVKDVSAQQWLP